MLQSRHRVLRREFNDNHELFIRVDETHTEVTLENSQKFNKIIDLQPAGGIG